MKIYLPENLWKSLSKKTVKELEQKCKDFVYYQYRSPASLLSPYSSIFNCPCKGATIVTLENKDYQIRNQYADEQLQIEKDKQEISELREFKKQWEKVFKTEVVK